MPRGKAAPFRGSPTRWWYGLLQCLIAVRAATAATKPRQLYFGQDYFNITFQGKPLPIITYKAPTYASNPLVIIIPGR
jgi:hypothetical protein